MRETTMSIDKGFWGPHNVPLLFIVQLALDRVGQIPYPWQPDPERAAWFDRYFEAVQDVADEDICLNPEDER